MSIQFHTIKEMNTLIQEKKLHPKEIYTECKNNITKYAYLNAIIETFDWPSESAFCNTILSQIPFINKDNILQKGKLATASSKILTNHTAPYTATVIERLLEKGSYTLGRANCDEFAMGSSGETSYYGAAKNPWNHTKIPGGSSSGSAVSVAAGLVPFSLGTETGGSVRQPAALCGITGLKTTYGLHSRYGIIAYASSLDQVGIFTRTAYDSAIVLSTTAGHDPYDNTTSNQVIRYDYTKNINNSVKGKKIAIITNALYSEGVTKETQKNLRDAIEVFKKLGVEIEEFSLNTMEYSAAIYFILSRAEAASNLSRFDGVKYGYRSPQYQNLESMYENTRGEGFGETVQKRIIIGNHVLGAEQVDDYYNKAKQIQNIMKKEFEEAFKKYDALFSPVIPDVAPSFGELTSLQIDLGDYFTCAANLVHMPAIAIPSGLINNLPMGFQLIGNYFSEELLLQLAHAYQKETHWHTLCPSLLES